MAGNNDEKIVRLPQLDRLAKSLDARNSTVIQNVHDELISAVEDVEKKLFSGDYNDLTNKPFYDTREYEDVVIEYDGNTEGRTKCSIPAMGISTAYKVADLTAEQLEQYKTSFANGFTLTYLKEDGSTEVVQSSVVYGFMGTSISLYAGGVGQVFLAVDAFSTEIGHADNYVNEAGIYFKEKTGTNPYKVIKLEFQNISGDLKIIEPQFLTNSPGIKVKEGESYISQYNSQTYVSQNNAEIFNDTRNIATGQYSHAEGTMTEAHGNYSHAEGNGSTAIGDYSHAEGASTQATGMASHSEGWNTTASGWYSHAEGQSTTAEGSYSHAEGDCNHAIGDNSHVEGTYNIAHGECQHVQGKHAIPDEEGRYAHIVGNGEYAQNRKKDSNAHTLDWDGNAWFAGDVFVKGTSQDDAKKLATEEFVNTTVNNIEIPTVTNDLTDELKANYDTAYERSESGQMKMYCIDGFSGSLLAAHAPSQDRENAVFYSTKAYITSTGSIGTDGNINAKAFYEDGTALENKYVTNESLSAVAKSGSYNDLTDKPCYETSELKLYTNDGDNTGRLIVARGTTNGRFAKISEDVIDFNSVDQVRLSMFVGDEGYEITDQLDPNAFIIVENETGSAINIDEYIICTFNDNFTMQMSGTGDPIVTFPEKGLYFAFNVGTGHVWRLDNVYLPIVSAKQLDEIFIPDTIARMDDVIELEEDNLSMEGLIDETYPNLITQDKTILGAINELARMLNGLTLMPTTQEAYDALAEKNPNVIYIITE